MTDEGSALSVYTERMTYGLTPVGPTGLASSVPAGASNLLLTAFPSLTDAQRTSVLAQTEIGSGYPLDGTQAADGSWQRLNLAAALSATVRLDPGGAVTVLKTGGLPAVTIAPVASFTSSVSGLGVSVNGGASSDPDGSVASYAWSFGDGGAATGATASHTYATAGTYSVTLTVTDNQGATNAVTKSVTVGSTNPGLFSDVFTRSLGGQWGSAASGGAWTDYGSASAFNVTGSVGQLSMASSGSGPFALLNSVSQANLNVVTDVGVNKAPTGNGAMVSTFLRQQGSGDDYRFKVIFESGGSVHLAVSKVVGGAEVYLSEVVVAGLTYTPGTMLTSRVVISGSGTTSITGKVWATGTAEPATAQISVTDSGASLQSPGAVGIQAYLFGSSTNAPVVASIDNLSGTLAGSPQANKSPVASFTSSVSGLGVSVNGGGSSDPDGSVASYAWSFGDGGAATGATASHTYATAGTYPVTLTVTDNQGATSAVTKSVTVGSTNPGLFSDAFTRSLSSQWGSATSGGAWTDYGSASSFSVTGSVGQLTMTAPGDGPFALLNSVVAGESERGDRCGVEQGSDR